MVDSIDSKSQSQKPNGTSSSKDSEPKVLSSFEDAMKTYEVTWAIREKGEESVLKNRKKGKK